MSNSKAWFPELELCPKCGSLPDIKIIIKHHTGYVTRCCKFECIHCGYSTEQFNLYDEAKAAWNKAAKREQLELEFGM